MLEISQPFTRNNTIFHNVKPKINVRCMGKFGRVKNWRIWQIMSHLPKFFSPIFTDTGKT